MNLFRRITFISPVMFILTVPAFAGVIVNSPANGSTVSSPFNLSAYATDCSSKSVVSMGYSFDSSSDTTVINSQSVNTSIPSATGTHVLHIKAWAPGVVCVSDVTINVTGAASASAASDVASAPAGADSVSDLQVLGSWSSTHDTAGSGTASGYTDLVSSPSLYGTSRRFITSFSNDGDERYSTVFSDNTSAKNFFYDGWVYLTSSSSMLANLEFDINQVMPNGQTVLAGVQCDGWSGQWDYTANQGSASSPQPEWVKASGTACNPQKWSQNTWHHVQFSLSRDDSGNVTYHSVWLDGTQYNLDATVPCAANLGWGPVVNTQFQTDGYGASGHITAYLDNVTISMW